MADELPDLIVIVAVGLSRPYGFRSVAFSVVMPCMFADDSRSMVPSTAPKSARAAIGFTTFQSDPILANSSVVVPDEAEKPSTLARSTFRIVLSRSENGSLRNVDSTNDDTRNTRGESGSFA